MWKKKNFLAETTWLLNPIIWLAKINNASDYLRWLKINNQNTHKGSFYTLQILENH